jgi:hypothetical protein
MNSDMRTSDPTWRYIPEDRTLHKHRCENLKSIFCACLNNHSAMTIIDVSLHVLCWWYYVINTAIILDIVDILSSSRHKASRTGTGSLIKCEGGNVPT